MVTADMKRGIKAEQVKPIRSNRTPQTHLEPPLLVVFSDAVILAAPSVQAAADPQDRSEQGAGDAVADPDGELERLGAEGSPRQGTVTWWTTCALSWGRCGMSGKMFCLSKVKNKVSLSHRCQSQPVEAWGRPASR